MTTKNFYPTDDYFSDDENPPIIKLTINPQFSPCDINIQYLVKNGWTNGDRLRVIPQTNHGDSSNPLLKAIGGMQPRVLIRRYDRDEDFFISLEFYFDGKIIAKTNNSKLALNFVEKTILDCPPTFHGLDDLQVSEENIFDKTEKAMFTGMLHGAIGWDSSHQIPDSIESSIEEARNSLNSANYRSCVTMCRRTVEALLKFAHERLLASKPVDRNGRSLMLAALIKKFREASPKPIPDHLLHLADSVRVIGNVPGAHAAEIDNYHFSRTDAEFALATTHYFVDQYFSKVDSEVNHYYTLTVNSDS